MTKLVPQNHPALHSIAEEVTPEEFADGTVTKIIKAMHKAMATYNAEGYIAVAIAAPQIGVAKRIFLISDQSKDRDPKDQIPDLVAINPRITNWSKKTKVLGEGCLSLPDYYGTVRRSTNVNFTALDEHGKEYSRGTGGLLAQIIQHECDHLDGTLFIDRAEDVYYKDELQR